MSWKVEEQSVSLWSVRHYAGGDTILEDAFRAGRTVWRIVPALPGKPGIEVAGWCPAPGVAYLTREAAERALQHAADNEAAHRAATE